MEQLNIKNFSFQFNTSDRLILDSINLSVSEGEFILLTGPSGCGKTTLLKHIKHIIAPIGLANGSIYYKQNSISAYDQRFLASEIGYVFQSPDYQIVCDKPFSEIAFGLENLGFPSDEIKRKVAEMASFFGIEKFFEKDIHTLSGGQKQMVNLAAVMVMQPKLLLLDEPTAMLDPICTNDFLLALNKLNKELGVTIILCEHQLENNYNLVDNICLMEDGRILYYESICNTAMKLIKSSHPLSAVLPTTLRLAPALSDEYLLSIRDCKRALNHIISEPNPVHTLTSDTVHTENNLKKHYSTDKRPCAVSLKGIHFRYPDTDCDLLNNLSLKVHFGEIFTILGGNGSGKTTLLSIISRILTPYKGKVSLSDSSCYLPQDPQALFLADTVYEDLKLLVKSNLINQARIDKLINLFEFFKDINTQFHLHPLDLSGGEKQLVSLFKLLLLDRKILLLDEPVKGLDSLAKEKLSDMLSTLKSKKFCIIMVTHDLEFAAENSDRCGLLFNGTLVSDAPPSNFFDTNHFYTTTAAKIAKGIIPNAVTIDDIIRYIDPFIYERDEFL